MWLEEAAVKIWNKMSEFGRLFAALVLGFIQGLEEEFFQNLVIINNSTNARYLTYQLKRHVRKLTRWNQGTSISGFLKKDLINLPIPLPCLPEQKAIASILSSSDSEIKALERKLALLRDRKKYLLNNLVTGTIRLPEFCKVVG